MNRKTYGRVFVVAAATVIVGCGSSSGGGADVGVGNTGSLSISITDAPVDDAVAVVVAMTELELKPAGDGTSFRIPVIRTARQLNLLDFTDGKSAEIIVDEEVPAGEYAWLRIFFDEALSFIQLESDGTVYPLVIPSGDETGYKLESGFTVPVNASVEYLLDFNVRESVVEPPSGHPGSSI